MARRTWEQITQTAANDEGMNQKDRAAFHYFNPNGLYAKKKANDEAITVLVDAGVLNSGWHLGSGTFNDYSVRRLEKLVTRKKPPSRDEMWITLKLLREDVIHVKAKLDAVYMGTYPHNESLKNTGAPK